MKLSTQENCLKIFNSFNGWEKEFDDKREDYSKQFPFSVIVEGAYPEVDMAVNWCLSNIGPADISNTWNEIKDAAGTTQKIQQVENGLWTSLWFDKVDYDYGFSEFYFKNEAQLKEFKEAVPTFFGTGPKGKWKTDGAGKFINL